MSEVTDTDELDYNVEAVRYPEDEPEAVTVQLMAILGEVVHRRRQVTNRPEPDPSYPEIGRYLELRTAVECLIDCAGFPFPDYRQKLIGIAALALDAVVVADAHPATSVIAATQPGA